MVDLSIQNTVDKFNKLPKSVQQTLLGTSTGWLTGFTLVKVGRYAAFSMGASILFIKIGHHFGYINIDWKSVNRDLKKAKKEVEKQASTHIPDLSEKVQDFIKDNAITASAFMGGFLLGASTA